MTPVRILFVDDSPMFLDSAIEFLARDPRVRVMGRAHNGLEGLRLVETLVPDLVLMDMVMPVMDGLHAVRAIKALPSPPRVVMVSLHDERAYRLSSLAAGADAFICKAQFLPAITAEIDAWMSQDPPR